MKNIKRLFSLLIIAGVHQVCYSQAWKSYVDSAKYYEERKLPDKALENYRKAKEVLRPNSFWTTENAATDIMYADLYYDLGQYLKAEPLYEEAKQILEKSFGNQHIYYATVSNKLGNVYTLLGQYAKAETFFFEAKQIREEAKGKQSTEYAESCNNLASLYQRMAQFDKAQALYFESLQLWEKLEGKESGNYAIACNGLAALYYRMGQYAKAQQLFLEAREIKKKINGSESVSYAISCNDLAMVYRESGSYDKAESLYLEAIKVLEKQLGKNHPEYATCCDNLALLYTYMGRYEMAEPLYLESMQIRMRLFGKQNLQYALSCNNLSLFYRETGDYEQAEMLQLETKTIQEKSLGTQHPDYATSCNNLGSLYYEIGQFEKAEKFFLESKRIREKTLGKQTELYATVCSNLALLYKDMGQYDKAAALYTEAIQIREQLFGTDNTFYATSVNGLGSVFKLTGQYKKAEPLFIESKNVVQRMLGKLHPNYASACNNLAALYRDIGQYQKAKILFEEGIKIREEVLGKKHPSFGSACFNLGTIYWVMHQPAEAEKKFKESFSVNAFNLESVFRFTNEKEKAGYVKNVVGEDDIIYSFYVSQKLASAHPYSLSLFHRNLLLSASQDLQKNIFATKNPELKNKYTQWINLRKTLAVLYSKPIGNRQEDLSRVEENADNLEKEIIRLAPGFAQNGQRVSWENIQAKLKADEAAIEFTSFHFFDGLRYSDSVYYVAMLLRKNMLLPITQFLFTEKQLSGMLANASDRLISNSINQLYSASNKTIYDIVWKPLEKNLVGIKTVYFAPSGLLHRLAFAALPINASEVLQDKYRLVQLTTTASLTDQTTAFISPPDSLRLYGGIRYDADSALLKQSARSYGSALNLPKTRSMPAELSRSGSFTYLPGTQSEIDAIEKQAKETRYQVFSLSGIRATEESFKALNNKVSPAVIHIATHGFFFPDPKLDTKDNFQKRFETNGTVFRQSDNSLFRAGIVFSGANYAWQGKAVEGIEDGILTAYEISNMYLPNTKLVVLSACETALGDIQGSEGVYGLQRAFKIAGVQQLVMSLWKVPDMETAEFMQLFYKNLFAHQSIAESFYNAQGKMKNKYKGDPYKWAAWILVR